VFLFHDKAAEQHLTELRKQKSRLPITFGSFRVLSCSTLCPLVIAPSSSCVAPPLFLLQCHRRRLEPNEVEQKEPRSFSSGASFFPNLFVQS
jgi:hypothetical protein